MELDRLRRIEELRARIARAEAVLASLDAERSRVVDALRALSPNGLDRSLQAALLREREEVGLRTHRWLNFKQALYCRLYLAECGPDLDDNLSEPPDG